MTIYHLHISRNTPCLLPQILHKPFVFHFSWVLQPSQEKLKTMLIKNIEGTNKVHFGICASGKWVLTFLQPDLPRPPSNIAVDPQTKQMTWKNVPGYKCLPESHFVVQYKKYSSIKWNNAGYFDKRTFDLKNATKGEKYHVQIYAINFVGKSQIKSVSFWTNSKLNWFRFFLVPGCHCNYLAMPTLKLNNDLHSSKTEWVNSLFQ